MPGTAPTSPHGPQSPDRSWTARILGPLHVTGPFWYRFHLFGVTVLPGWLVGFTIRVFTAGFFVALVRIRRAIVANLEAVLGPAGWWGDQRRAYRTLFTFAWSLTERYEWLAGKTRTEATLDGVEAWNALTASGTGFIVVTAHVGNWEIGSALPATRERRRVHLVREEELDPRSQAFIREQIEKRASDLYTTHFAGDDLRLGMVLREALVAGDIVALQADRPRAGGKVIRASLFGRPFAMPVGPFALARVAGVPLLPVFMLRQGRGSYRVHVRNPIAVSETGSREDDLRRAAARLAEEIEWAIRKEPHQWYCFNHAWSSRETEVRSPAEDAAAPPG